MSKHSIEFVPSGRGPARCAPNAAYPNGIAVDIAGDKPACEITLPYPAPECGAYYINCNCCGLHFAVTAAGRPDDPISVRVPCKGQLERQAAEIVI